MEHSSRTHGAAEGGVEPNALVCGYLISGVAFALPVLSGMLFLLRNYLATEGEVTPPLDDTLIYFQYARTFVEGDPFAWIPEGGYSTGATSYLYLVFLALAYALGLQGAWLYTAAWSFGLLCFSVALWRLGMWAFRSYGLFPALGGMLSAGSAGLILWCTHSGMDSMFLLVTMVLAAEVIARLRRGDVSMGPVHLLFFALLPVVRPEAGVLGCVLALSLVPGRGKAGLRQGLALMSFCLMTILAIALVNHFVTGTSASNGVITKSWMSDPTRLFSERLAMVFAETGTFLSRFVYPDQAPERALLIPLFLYGAWRLIRDGDQGWLLVVVVVLGIGLTLQSSYANVHRNRYQAPFLGIAFFIAGMGFVHLCIHRMSFEGRGRWALGLVALLLLGLVGAKDANAWAWRFALEARDTWRHPVAMGRWIGSNLPDESVVAVHDAGGMPYYSSHPRFLDLVGLGTNGMGRWYRSGPGSLFERLESLPEEERPTHYAVYTDWFEDVDILGETQHVIALEHVSIVPNQRLHLLSARNEQFGRGHSPWAEGISQKDVLDAIDLADLDSESQHHFDPGPRPGMTRYMRGSTPDGGVGGDGARWLRAELGFSLESDSSERLKLVLRLGADKKTRVRYRVNQGDEGVLDLDGDGTLRDYVVLLTGLSSQGRLNLRVAPADKEAVFLARAYLASP